MSGGPQGMQWEEEDGAGARERDTERRKSEPDSLDRKKEMNGSVMLYWCGLHGNKGKLLDVLQAKPKTSFKWNGFTDDYVQSSLWRNIARQFLLSTVISTLYNIPPLK